MSRPEDVSITSVLGKKAARAAFFGYGLSVVMSSSASKATAVERSPLLSAFPAMAITTLYNSSNAALPAMRFLEPRKIFFDICFIFVII